MIQRLHLLNIFLLLLVVTFGKDNDNQNNGYIPDIVWSTELPGSGSLGSRGLRKGNGVTYSSDNHLWLTTDDGTLFILQSWDGKVKHQYTPHPNNSKTYCYSQVDLLEQSWGVDYGVYSVYDVNMGKSLVIALNNDASLKWQVSLDGVSYGTPRIGQNGKYVYVTFNQNLDDAQNVECVLAVIRDGWGSAFVAKLIRIDNNSCAPVSVYKDNNNVQDVVYWTSAGDVGTGVGQNGAIFRYTKNHQNATDTSFDLMQDSMDFHSMTSPLVSSDGRSMWLTGSNSNIRAYVDMEDFQGKETSWTRELLKELRNSTSPILASAVSTSKFERLFAPSAGNAFYCLDPKTGSQAWMDYSYDMYFTEARLSEKYNRVYISRHRKGTIVQLDLWNWWHDVKMEFNCADFNDNDPDCEDSIEAEFTLSKDGAWLFFGDIYGRVTASQVWST